MSDKLNVPDQIFLGKKEYSWMADLQVNGWLFVATLISGFSDILFARMVREWPLGWRVGLVLAQFIAILLWLRNLAGWIRGMDELHRRITVSATLFATSATFFVMMLLHRLAAVGLFQSVTKPGRSWDFSTPAHCFLLLTLFYFLGHSIFNRRYQ